MSHYVERISSLISPTRSGGYAAAALVPTCMTTTGSTGFMVTYSATAGGVELMRLPLAGLIALHE
jgi:hypothetical protein